MQVENKATLGNVARGFFGVCAAGKSARGLRIVQECRDLPEAREALKIHSTYTPKLAIYQFTWGEKPQFIEGDTLFSKE